MELNDFQHQLTIRERARIKQIIDKVNDKVRDAREQLDDVVEHRQLLAKRAWYYHTQLEELSHLNQTPTIKKKIKQLKKELDPIDQKIGDLEEIETNLVDDIDYWNKEKEKYQQTLDNR